MTRALAAAVALLGACSQPPPPPAPPRPPAPTTPTTVATTTTAAVRAPSAPVRVSPPPPVRADPAGAVAARGDVWSALARCESGMRNLRNAPYSGYFQFTRPTWRSLGYSGVAADHPYSVQLAAAKRLLARSGASQWPTCGRRVGL